VKNVRSPSGCVMPTERVALRPDRPVFRARPVKGFAQPAAELVGTDIGRDLEVDADAFQASALNCPPTTDAQFVMIDDDLGARLRPGARRGRKSGRH
jgi:hypothetical protein